MKINAYTKTTVMPLLYIITAGTNRAYAQPTWEKLSLKGIVDIGIQALADVLIPLAVTVLFFVFVYGIVLYMRAASKGDGNLADIAKNASCTVSSSSLPYSLSGDLSIFSATYSPDKKNT